MGKKRQVVFRSYRRLYRTIHDIQALFTTRIFTIHQNPWDGKVHCNICKSTDLPHWLLTSSLVILRCRTGAPGPETISMGCISGCYMGSIAVRNVIAWCLGRWYQSRKTNRQLGQFLHFWRFLKGTILDGLDVQNSHKHKGVAGFML